jgi:hypothetical protein
MDIMSSTTHFKSHDENCRRCGAKLKSVYHISEGYFEFVCPHWWCRNKPLVVVGVAILAVITAVFFLVVSLMIS